MKRVAARWATIPAMHPRPAIPAPAVAALRARWRLRRLAFFGSVLREDFGAESDVDVLVEFESGATPGFFAMEDLRAELSELLGGRAIDLVTSAALHPLLRDRILSQAIEQPAV